MRRGRAALYFFSFAGLAATAALAFAGVGEPSVAPALLAAAMVAALAGAPGLVHRRAWPLSLLLLPLGALLLVRAQVTIPPDVHGAGGQLAYLVQQLQAGAQAYRLEHFPLDLSPGSQVTVLLSLVVYAVVGLAAFLALSLRLALPAIAVVLILLGFALTTDRADKLVLAPVAFLLLAGCMLLLSRSLRRERWRATDALAGAGTAIIAVLLALSLLGATSVAASTPLWDWSTWGIAGPGDARVGFDWMQSYLRLLQEPSDAEVMRVESPVASYWRANALTSFDGNTWFNGSSYDQLPLENRPGSVAFTVPARPPEPPGQVVTQSFQLESTYTDHLFVGGTPRSVLLDQPGAQLWVTDAQALQLNKSWGPTLRYTVQAVVPQVKPADLLDRGSAYPEDVVLTSLGLPFPTRAQLQGPDPEAAWRAAMSGTSERMEWLGLLRLNDQIVGATSDPYRITLQVEEYLRTHFTYSLDPPPTNMTSPYADFLFGTKTGYCQHFAGAMAVLLRFNGIPARVAVGFSAGRKTGDGSYVVTRKDAHAWVEAFFPGVGWVPFDPTPGHIIPVAGPSSASAGFVDPTLAAAAAAAGKTGRTGAPTHGQDPRGAPGGGRAGAAPVSGLQPGSPRPAPWLVAAASLVALLIAWPLGRAAVRRRATRRGSFDRRLSVSLALVSADLRDYGVHVPPSQTLDETARFVETRFGIEAAPLMERMQAVLFGGRAATPEDLAGLTAFRRELRRGLRAQCGHVKACLALYGVSAGTAAGD